jgi:hypothetical protein
MSNHVCLFNITSNKKCGILVCSLFKTDKLLMDDCVPHRCQQHALMCTNSSYEKSGSTLATSSSAYVSRAQLSMAATNRESSSISAVCFQKSFATENSKTR